MASRLLPEAGSHARVRPDRADVRGTARPRAGGPRRASGRLAQWRGWVAFDNSGPRIDPVSMSYFDGSQTLTQLFKGTALTFPPR
jgi:hypothetical protein